MCTLQRKRTRRRRLREKHKMEGRNKRCTLQGQPVLHHHPRREEKGIASLSLSLLLSFSFCLLSSILCFLPFTCRFIFFFFLFFFFWFGLVWDRANSWVLDCFRAKAAMQRIIDFPSSSLADSSFFSSSSPFSVAMGAIESALETQRYS